ncbi:Uncharacterized protein APZ42_007517, partial [Daphnia magna]
GFQHLNRCSDFCAGYCTLDFAAEIHLEVPEPKNCPGCAIQGWSYDFLGRTGRHENPFQGEDSARYCSQSLMLISRRFASLAALTITSWTASPNRSSYSATLKFFSFSVRIDGWGLLVSEYYADEALLGKMGMGPQTDGCFGCLLYRAHFARLPNEKHRSHHI